MILNKSAQKLQNNNYRIISKISRNFAIIIAHGQAFALTKLKLSFLMHTYVSNIDNQSIDKVILIKRSNNNQT